MTKDFKIRKIDYHRNGISGEGFHVATLDCPEGGRMVAIVFEGAGQCAVLNIEETAKDNIEFAQGNSWRGDWYEKKLREAIKQHEKEEAEKWAKK